MVTPVNQPIANLGNLYVNNLQVSWASTTTLTIAAGQARDASDTCDLTLASTTTVNAATNGANGLDTGALANSTWYAVFVIGSSGNNVPTATILSTSATTPYLPSGYDAVRRIGWVKTDGSAHFLKVYITGNAHERLYRWDSVITVKSSGAGNSSFQALSLSSAMPATSTHVDLQTNLTANTAGNSVNVRPTGSSSSANIGTNNPVTTVAQLNMLTGVVTNSSQSIDWKTAENTDTLAIWVVGFTDYI